MKRAARALLGLVLALVVLVPLAALVAAQFWLTGDRLKADLADAVRRATGRELSIGGKVGLSWSLTPALAAEDVSLSNPPGLSRPALVHLDRVEARLDVLQLLSRRIAISRLVLTGPDLLLERDAAGRPNWRLAPPAAPAASAPAAAPAPAGPRLSFALGAVEIRAARVGWHGAGGVVQIEVPRLDYAPDSLRVAGELRLHGVPLALSGTAGPIAGADWPVQLNLVGGGAAASLAGSTAQAAMTVLVPQLAAASALAGTALPALHDVAASATLGKAGLADLRITTGAASFGPLALVSGILQAPGLDRPVTSTAQFRFGGLPLAAAANAGSLAALLGGGPIPVQLMLATGDAVLTGEGTVTRHGGGDGDGAQLTLAGSVPDLGALGRAAGLGVPGLRDVHVQARIASVASGLAVRGLQLSSSAGDLAGDLALGLTPRPFVRGTLVSQRVDLDGWQIVPPPAAAPPPAAPPPAVAPAPAPASAGTGRVIPDVKLPLAMLRQVDADLRLALAEAVWRGASYRAVDSRLRVADGALALDPLSLQGPGGPVRATLTATADPAGVGVTAHAPGLAAGPLLAAFGAPALSSGTVDLDLDLRGRGDTLRAVAASLDGHLGIAMVDGEVDNRWLADLLSDALRAANLPAEPGGRSRLRCFALRADAQGGRVRVPTVVLDTTKLKLDGEGELNLTDETLLLHVRPQLRLGAVVAVPLRLSGTFRAPKAALDPGALGNGRVGVSIGGPASPDACGPALALARMGHAGPQPQTPADAARPARPADLLRSLLR